MVDAEGCGAEEKGGGEGEGGGGGDEAGLMDVAGEASRPFAAFHSHTA